MMVGDDGFRSEGVLGVMEKELLLLLLVLGGLAGGQATVHGAVRGLRLLRT